MEGMVEQIVKLTLLGDIFLCTTNQLSELRKLPKQRFAREVLTFFDILEQAEYSILTILSSLCDFEREKTVGMRVFYIHKVGQSLNGFGQSCEKFILWVDKHEELSNVLEILAPNAKERLGGLIDPDSLFTLKGDVAYCNLAKTIHVLRECLQATKSPDPKQFPSESFVSEIINQFNQILQQVRISKQRIREFASENLIAKDFL